MSVTEFGRDAKTVQINRTTSDIGEQCHLEAGARLWCCASLTKHARFVSQRWRFGEHLKRQLLPLTRQYSRVKVLASHVVGVRLAEALVELECRSDVECTRLGLVERIHDQPAQRRMIGLEHVDLLVDAISRPGVGEHDRRFRADVVLVLPTNTRQIESNNDLQQAK